MEHNNFFFLLCFCLSIVLTACQKNQMIDGDEPIRLGAIYNLTGDQAELDIPSANGAQLAIGQINAGGGLLGREVDLIVKDGKTDTAEVRQGVADVSAQYPNVTAFLGLSDTDQALSAAPAAKAAGRVFLTSGATSPLLPAQVPDYLYLACFGDNVQAAAAAEWAYNELNARTVAVLYDSVETYTILLQKYFVARFESLGGKIVSTEGFDPENTGQVGKDLPAADFIFLSATPAQRIVPIIRQIRQSGINSPIVGGDGYDAESVWEAAPDISNVFYATHAYLGADNSNNLVQNFRQAYLRTYGSEPTAFAALGYDAVNLLAEAITQAGNTDPDSVRLALAQLKDIPGVSGTVSFNGGEQIPQKSVSMIEIEDGKLIFRGEIRPEFIPNP